MANKKLREVNEKQLGQGLHIGAPLVPKISCFHLVILSKYLIWAGRRQNKARSSVCETNPDISARLPMSQLWDLP